MALWKFAIIIIPIAMFFYGPSIYQIFNPRCVSLDQEDARNEAVSQETRNLFSSFDWDSDGFLDAHEFQAAIKHVLNHLGPSSGTNQTVIINCGLLSVSCFHKPTAYCFGKV